MITLQKAIQNLGVSRRNSAEIIKNEGVLVNNKIIKKPWYELNENDEIIFNKKVIKVSQIIEKEMMYFLFNKPKGVLTTLKDDFGRKTLKDYIINITTEKLFYVGRLDKETTGLLLLTNDGDFANYLLKPSSEIIKTYEVLINGNPSKSSLQKLEKGLILENGYKTKPAKIEKVKKKGNNHFIVLSINEGKKRQVRYMFKQIGYKVVELKRVRFGPWSIDLVPNEGMIKKINSLEIEKYKLILKKGDQNT